MRHKGDPIAFARVQQHELMCALADENRDLQKLVLHLHEICKPTMSDYRSKLLDSLMYGMGVKCGCCVWVLREGVVVTEWVLRASVGVSV